MNLSMRMTLTVFLLLILSLAAPLMAQEIQPDPIGQRPDAPSYAVHGSYWVGTEAIELDQGTDDARRFTIWYPALNPDSLEESVVYEMSENHDLRDMIPADSPFTVLGHALADAAPDLSDAPYPLVIVSHAFTAQMWQMYLGEHLASYGFVVVAPEHASDSWANVYTSTVIRMFEVKQAILDAESLTTPDGALAGMIDVEHIAVGGHSSGGMTAYAAGGALLDWAAVEELCSMFPDIPDCADLDIQFQQITELTGADSWIDGEHEAIWDDRIDAIFPMAGTVELHGARGLQSISIPMLTLFGSLDPMLDWLTPAYQHVSSTEKAQVIFTNGGHGVFYPECDLFPYIVQYDLYWGCSDPVWDLSRAQDITNHFVTAFLLDVLKGDEAAHAALAPDAVSFPGIEYQAEGF